MLWSPYGIGQTIIFSSCRLFYLSSFFFFSSSNLSGRRLDVYNTWTHGVALVMVALWNRADHYIFALWLLLLLFPRLISAVADWMSAILPHMVWRCGLSANLRCRNETCCTRLAENTGRKNSPKKRHLGTIAQLCRAISSQLRHTYRQSEKKLVKKQYLLHMSPQYGELLAH